MDLKRSIALKVGFIRSSNKLNQSEFADEIGISRSLVSKIENGLHAPSCEIIKAICEKYNVSSDWLLDVNSKINNSFQSNMDEKQYLLLNAYSKLLENEREVIDNLIKIILSNKA